jgi:hypothetical protein
MGRGGGAAWGRFPPRTALSSLSGYSSHRLSATLARTEDHDPPSHFATASSATGCPRLSGYRARPGFRRPGSASPRRPIGRAADARPGSTRHGPRSGVGPPPPWRCDRAPPERDSQLARAVDAAGWSGDGSCASCRRRERAELEAAPRRGGVRVIRPRCGGSGARNVARRTSSAAFYSDLTGSCTTSSTRTVSSV